MAVELEGLEFQIEAESSKAVKGIDALSKSLASLKKATKGGLGLTSQVKQLEKLNNAISGLHCEKLETLGKALESIGSASNTKFNGSLAKRLSSLVDTVQRIDSSDIYYLNQMADALKNLGEVSNVKIPKISTPKTGVTPADTGAAGAGAVDSGIENAASQVQEVGAAVSQVTGRTNVLKNVLSGVGGVFHKGFSVGVGVLKTLGKALSSTASMAAKFARGMNNIRKSLGSSLAASVKQHTAGLGQLFSSLKRIAMYRMIRAAISALTKALKEGINNLYQYSALMGGTFAGSMDRLATSSSYLKNSLGAMAAPIINALAPAIDFVIDKVAALLNMINMLFARLSGASVFTAAKKNAKSYGDSLAKAGGGAAKAAKEIRDATTGIDELNIIMEKDNSGGGGGGGGTDYGSMFEELPIDSGISEFADKLKEAFNNADWKTLGTLLGDKVNEIIDSIDYAEIGKKVGFGLNGAIQTAYWFLDTVNFTNIGKHIAEFLNNALEEIDFSYIGRLFVKKFTILPDLLIGFFSELDWGLVARKFSEFLIGAFDEATKWLNKYDWSELGTLLWQKIKDLVTNIDWAGIAESMFTFLGTAIRSVVQFVGSFFGSIGADIKSWWDTEIAGEDWKETASNLLNAIGEGFVNIGTWVFDHIIDPFCTALLGEDVWADVKQAGSDMWAGFTQGITEFFNDPLGWIDEHIVTPFVNSIKNLFGIHSSSTVMKEIGGYVIQGLLDGILAPFKAIGKWINKNIVRPLKDAFEDVDLVEFAVGVKNTATEWWSNVKRWWANKVGAVQSFTTSVKNKASTWWSNTKTWWSGKVGKVKEFTTHVTNQATTWWSNTKTWWSGKVGAVKEFTTTVTNQSATWWANVKSWWSGRVGAVQQFTTSVKNKASTWWSNTKTWWSGKVGAVQQFVTSVKDESTSWWNNTKTYWSGKVGAVQQFTTSVKNDSQTWWNNVKTWWSGVVGNFSVSVAIRNEATTWWNNVKSWWSNAVGTLWTTLNIKIPEISVSWGEVTALGQTFRYPNGFNLTWNAKGGILDGAQIFGMLGNSFLGGGEAGKEAVLPLESHTEWMDTLAEKVRSGLPEDGEDMSYSGFKRAMAEFYTEYMQGTMNQIASDTNRQANKKEQTTVQIGSRTITDTVKKQQDANGYVFTT